MPTPVFLTVDTEIMWRHHVNGLDPATLYERSFEPAGVGVSYQLERLRRHGLKASFFIDPMPALVYGLDPIKRIVETVLRGGQEVQLHLHPNWAGAKRDDGGANFGKFDLSEYSRVEQETLITGARELLVAAGAPNPIAFRAGNYAGNDDTMAALAALGFAYDSSHNGSAHPFPSAMTLQARQIAPIAHRGLTEVPVTLIEDRMEAYRNFQICALSTAEMRAALDHAIDQSHAAVTIVNHGFELANRQGTMPNNVHVRRFDSLCAMLAERQDMLPTRHFAAPGPLTLGSDDAPVGASGFRRRMRQAEQFWSNFVEERVA